MTVVARRVTVRSALVVSLVVAVALSLSSQQPANAAPPSKDAQPTSADTPSKNVSPSKTAAPSKNASPSTNAQAAAETASVPAADPKASASSGSGAGRAVDGDLGTAWTASGGGEQWLSLDLRTVQTVTAVQQTFDADQVWKFAIEGSVDGKEWVGLVDRSFGAAGRTFAESVSGQYRYVRMTVLAGTTGAPASSRELTVSVSPDGPDLALGASTTASSSLPGYPADKAVDHNTSTYWVGGGSGPQQLTVDLGAVSRVRRVEQQFKDADVFVMQVEGSTDGNQWTLIGDNSAGISGQTFSYPTDGQYRYVRLSVTSSPRGFWVASTSFMVFGDADLTAQATLVSADGDADGAAAVLDGTTGAQWYAPRTNARARPSMVVDLGAPTVLGQVQATFAGALRHRPSIETSADGRRWKPARVSTQAGVATAEPSAATPVRFVRLKTTAPRTAASALTGLGITGAATQQDLSTHTLTQAPDSAGSHPGTLATDGDSATAWRAETTDATLTVDLGNVAAVRELEQTFETSGTWRFLVEGSRDGRSWTVLADERAGAKGRTFARPASGLYRYLRLSAPKGAPKLTSSSFVVRGYGSPIRTKWWEQMSGARRYYAKYYDTTLKQITAQLDTLRAEGYQIIEPFAPYEGPTEDFAGLGATDNFRVDPSIGTMEDLHALIEAAHARGMKVVSFLNLGYSHVTAPFFEKAVRDFQNGVTSTERSWFALKTSSDDCAAEDPHWRRYSDPKTGKPTDVCFYAYWGEKIPSYDWNSTQWQSEARRITQFWMQQGFDGLGFDAPEVMLNVTGEKLRRATVEVLDNYDAYDFPEGVQPVCCGFPLPIAEQDGFRHWVRDNGFNVIQDLSTTFWGGGGWGRVLTAARNGDPSELDEAFKQGRDLVNQYGGTTYAPPSWEVDLQDSGPVSASDRLLEIATLTTAGQMFYLHAGYHEYQPEVSVLPTWSTAERKRLADLMRAQASYAALDPVGLRVKLETNNKSVYAYVRRDMAGGVKSLVVHNFSASEVEVTVDLAGSGLSLAQTPTDLITGDAGSAITDAEYTVRLPAKGSTLLGVR